MRMNLSRKQVTKVKVSMKAGKGAQQLNVVNYNRLAIFIHPRMLGK